ncbi:MAG: GIY-YIG nuclease family protein [Candidatus Shapirobacteria bacterium]|nr:GIY-YIG nuclease family protein [Candidatus Shapirobacteria bacterium]
MIGFIYILKSIKNKRFYIGSTTDIQRRLIEHNSGRSKYTSFTRPFELIFSQKFNSISIARKVEFKIKQFKSKKVIIKIIESGEIKINQFYNISW